MAKTGILVQVAKEHNTTVKELLVSTFREHQGISATAAALGTTRQTLWRTMKKYGIESVTTLVEAQQTTPLQPTA